MTSGLPSCFGAIDGVLQSEVIASASKRDHPVENKFTVLADRMLVCIRMPDRGNGHQVAAARVG